MNLRFEHARANLKSQISNPAMRRWTASALILVAVRFSIRTVASRGRPLPARTVTPAPEGLRSPYVAPSVDVPRSPALQCSGESHLPIDQTWWAGIDKLTREGWTVDGLTLYVGLTSGWTRCRTCLAKAREYLRIAPSLRDPVCEVLFASLPEKQFL